jgi:uncharacterized membrane protein YfcA
MSAWLPDAPWYILAAVPFVVLIAYMVFGATGFGSSIISIPALAHWSPLTFAVPLVTALDCAATINASYRQWRRADFAEFRRIVPAMLVGIAVGTTVLFKLPRAPALLALGVFVVMYGVYLLAGGRREWKAVRPLWAWPVGLVGGMFSAVFGTGGPIYMVYLAARIHDKTVLRATSSLIVTVSVTLRTAVFIVTGLLLKLPVVVAAALLLPVMLAGYHLGNRAHHALSRTGVMKIIATLLVINGASLVVRAFALWRSE